MTLTTLSSEAKDRETDATANPLWGEARKLERERDEARADCERLNRLLRHETALGQGEIDHWAALERERDGYASHLNQVCDALGMGEGYIAVDAAIMAAAEIKRLKESVESLRDQHLLTRLAEVEAERDWTDN